jgi:chromosome segregation ATPase
MAFGGKEAVASQLAALNVRVEMLTEQLAEKKEEIRGLKAALSRTQSALIAKEAPEAYLDQRYDAVESNMSEEEKRARRIQGEIAAANQTLIRMTEEPLFRDRDEMIDMLSEPPKIDDAPSLHGDGES